MNNSKQPQTFHLIDPKKTTTYSLTQTIPISQPLNNIFQTVVVTQNHNDNQDYDNLDYDYPKLEDLEDNYDDCYPPSFEYSDIDLADFKP